MKEPSDPTSDKIARLGELYRTDPEAFEAMRKLLIEETIEGFPPEHRARAYGLQFRIDSDLSRYKDPVARMNRMVEIFWEGVNHFESAISNPESFLRQKNENRQTDNVIPFPRRPLH